MNASLDYRPTDLLYVAAAVEMPVAKVGVSARPRDRVVSFAMTAPFALRFHRVLDCGSRMSADAWEAMILHHATRYRPGGEWVVIDRHLEALLEEVAPAHDVTDQFHGRACVGRSYDDPERAEMADQWAERVSRSGNRTPSAARYQHGYAGDRAVILARLREGYGAEDVRVMDGIPVETFWEVAAGQSRRIASPVPQPPSRKQRGNDAGRTQGDAA